MDLSQATWRKSSYSGGGNQCVEVGAALGVVGLRDTKDLQSGTLVVPARRFADFIAAVKAGELDR
ncbi:DUF397 domain-containing protein [Saccharopolyspora tripterygii]